MLVMLLLELLKDLLLVLLVLNLCFLLQWVLDLLTFLLLSLRDDCGHLGARSGLLWRFFLCLGLPDDLLRVRVVVNRLLVTNKVVLHCNDGAGHCTLRALLLPHNRLGHVKCTAIFLVGEARPRDVWVLPG